MAISDIQDRSNALAADQLARSPEELLTVEDVALMFKVPVSWVYARTRRRNGDKLPHIRLGKYIRFEEHEILRYLARKRHRNEPSFR